MTDLNGTASMDSPVGTLLLVAREDGLTHLLFADTTRMRPEGDGTRAAAGILAETERQLNEYFVGRRREFDVPLSSSGTDFQLAVWCGLRDIPFGETISYGELARRIGREKAVRAVGAANGANPISIIVPCHRVIGANRRLTGFGGGLPAKKTLLELEGGRLEGDRLV
jgi:methylated-DNA-[protein]-cysteine S-methyltransferase